MFEQEKKKLAKELGEVQKRYDAVLNMVFEAIKDDLAAYDTCIKISNLGAASNYWNRAKEMLIRLKKAGFEQEVKDFLKREQRNKKLLK